MDLTAPRAVNLPRRPEHANATVPTAYDRFSMNMRPSRELSSMIGIRTNHMLAWHLAVRGDAMRNRHAFRTFPTFISLAEETCRIHCSNGDQALLENIVAVGPCKLRIWL